MDPTAGAVAGLASQAALGVALAACAGLRAFVPLFVAGLAARFDVLPIAEHFQWLASDAALVVLGVAVVVEVAADKIPIVDHALDLVQTVVKPLAGTLLAAGMLGDLGPVESTVIGLVAGGGVAGTVHLAKAKLRLASTVATIGLANPVLSIVEDAMAVVGAVVAIVLPLLVLAAVLCLAAGLAFVLWQRRGHSSVSDHVR